MADRESCIYLAKLAEQAERYDEMVDYMKKVAVMGAELSVEERNLLSVAYKNVIGARRASWRIVSSIQAKEAAKGASPRADIIGDYKNKVEKELAGICNDVLALLTRILAGLADSAGESRVFFQKMQGDYFRYLAEFQAGAARTDAAEKASRWYKEAVETARVALPPTHPIRLGLALNYSVFFYEILHEADQACKLAKAAFDEAISELDALSEDSYKDSTLIMQLLRDNLTLWTTDMSGDKDGGRDAQD